MIYIHIYIYIFEFKDDIEIIVSNIWHVYNTIDVCTSIIRYRSRKLHFKILAKTMEMEKKHYVHSMCIIHLLLKNK